ncbi:hypothetical protein BDR06DRAFT_976972 [Suillus hirtellus]|nr:hypothetical protein BDR06DRAFT_976972 [Suillus hirtellus]
MFPLLLLMFPPHSKSPQAFGAQKPSSHVGQCKLLLEMSHSILMPLSMTHNTTPLSNYHVSPTLQTSLPNSAGGLKKKKAKLDVLQEVGHVWDEIESVHSNAMSCHNSKHQRFLVKLDAKSKHHWDLKKYEWLCGVCEHEASQATVSHQCLQEQQDAKICLHEMDIQVHQVHSLVLDKEAETLQLKIQFHQMMQGNWDPSVRWSHVHR